MKLYILISLALFLFSACDPARFILITQQKKDVQSSIVFEFKKIEKKDYSLITSSKDSIKIVKYIDGKPEGILFDAKKENAIKVNFPRDTNKKEIELLFGWGTWSEQTISDFSELLNSICITKGEKTSCYKSNEDIFNLLITHESRGTINFAL